MFLLCSLIIPISILGVWHFSFLYFFLLTFVYLGLFLHVSVIFFKIVSACSFGGNSLKIMFSFCFLLHANTSLMSQRSSLLLSSGNHLTHCSVWLIVFVSVFSNTEASTLSLVQGNPLFAVFSNDEYAEKAWWQSYCHWLPTHDSGQESGSLSFCVCVYMCVCVLVIPSICPRLALSINVHGLAELDEMANWFGQSPNQSRRCPSGWCPQRSSSLHRTYTWPPQAQFDEQLGSQIRRKFPPLLSMLMTPMKLAA